MSFSPQFKLTYRDLLAGVLIMLFAFALRVIVVFDRAAGDPAFIPQVGTDQEVYVDLAGQYEAGNWPTAPFRWQPGIVYALVGIRALVGETVGQMSLGTALLGAWSCGLMVAIGWLVTRRRWGGYLAGLLLAVYPVAAFFSTVLLTEGLASVLVIAFLFLTLWQREKLSLWRSALLGITLGILTITRTNLAMLWLAWAVLLWLDNRHLRPFAVHAGISLLLMLLAIAPVTLWNRQSSGGDEFPLVTTTGMDEIYRANNRDADGLRNDTPAMQTAIDVGYQEALLADISRDPLRFIQLQFRKAGIYWSAVEPGNNIDYLQSGETPSPLLRMIPLDFRVIALLGWMGVVLLLTPPPTPPVHREGEKNIYRYVGIFFALVNLLIFAGVMPLWAEGRLKQPAVAPLVITAAFVIIQIIAWIKARDWQKLARRAALPAVGMLLIFGGLDWAAANWPQMRPAAELPNDVRRMDVTFGDQLKLIGWRTLPEWPAAERGWTHFLRSYTVQLYWEVLQPVSEDYNLYLAFVPDGERAAGVDRAIGTVSYRPKPTSEWMPGEIYAEIIGFRIPQAVTLERSGDVQLGVYLAPGDPNDPNRVITPIPITSLENAPTSINLQRLAVFDTGYIGGELEDFTSSEAFFGGQIALKGYGLPEQTAPNEAISIKLYWKALAEMTSDYTILVHVEDEAGNMIAPFDVPPRGNTLPTSTWPPDYPLADEIVITAPSTPGLYRVYIGWYDPLTLVRLPAGTLDDRLLLGEIRVN